MGLNILAWIIPPPNIWPPHCWQTWRARTYAFVPVAVRSIKLMHGRARGGGGRRRTPARLGAREGAREVTPPPPLTPPSWAISHFVGSPVTSEISPLNAVMKRRRLDVRSIRNGIPHLPLRLRAQRPPFAPPPTPPSPVYGLISFILLHLCIFLLPSGHSVSSRFLLESLEQPHPDPLASGWQLY